MIRGIANNAKLLEQYERRRQLERDDVAALLRTPEGRRFIWRILERAGVYRTTFTGNSTTFFREGRRSVGLLIKEDLMAADPDHEGKMARDYESWVLRNGLTELVEHEIREGGRYDD